VSYAAVGNSWRHPAVFSASREAALVREYLAGDEPGVFVEVGANDPTHHSATHHLEEIGWTGLLVEPLPDCVRALREARKAIVVEAACGAPWQAGRMASLHVAGPHSSLDPNLAEPRSKTGVFIEVMVCTLDNALDSAEIADIDLLAVDTEGTEIDVLEGINLNARTPSLILLEDHVRDWSKCRYMSGRGYRLVRRTGFNSWYVPADAPFPIGVWGRVQLFLKYVLDMPFKRLRYWRHKRETVRP
jgi:FkbM family methyltransferase